LTISVVSFGVFELVIVPHPLSILLSSFSDGMVVGKCTSVVSGSLGIVIVELNCVETIQSVVNINESACCLYLRNLRLTSGKELVQKFSLFSLTDFWVNQC
jgi:hypothetical protein